MPRIIDLKAIRSLKSATQAGWDTTQDSQIGYDRWVERYGEDQVPRLLKAMDDLVQLAQAVDDSPAEYQRFVVIENR